MGSVRHVMNISFCHHFFIFLSFLRFVKPVLNIQPVFKRSVGHSLARDQAALLGKGQKIERNGIHVKQSASWVVHWGRGKTAELGGHAFDAAVPLSGLLLGSLCSTIFFPFPANCGAWSQPSHTQSRETALLLLLYYYFYDLNFFGLLYVSLTVVTWQHPLVRLSWTLNSLSCLPKVATFSSQLQALDLEFSPLWQEKCS